MCLYLQNAAIVVKRQKNKYLIINHLNLIERCSDATKFSFCKSFAFSNCFWVKLIMQFY